MKLGNILRRVFTKGSEAGKVIMLALGLAMGLVLVAKVYFEQTYDSYIPGRDRTCIIGQLFKRGNDPTTFHTRTAGAVAPGLKEYSPAVEVATRYTYAGNDVEIKLADSYDNLAKDAYKAHAFIFADSSFFSIFERDIIVGVGAHTLAQPEYAMISKSFAEMVSKSEGCNLNDLLGRTFAVGVNETTRITIGGIFADFPANSQLYQTEIIASLQTIGRYMWDGTENWVGNDRYHSIVRLIPNAQVSDVDNHIATMVKEKLPLEELEKAGVELTFRLMAMEDYMTEDSKTLVYLFIVLAAMVILSATLNYVLVSISTMVQRAKTVAVHKCYGASRGNIFKMLLTETNIHLILSLLLAALLITFGSRKIEEIIGTSIVNLITPASVLILVAICVGVLLVGALLPGMVYSKVPVAVSFRRYNQANRGWKSVLLFFEFTASTFFIALLCVLVFQYQYMKNVDTGYAHKQLAYVEIDKLNNEQRNTLQHELSKLPFIQSQSLAYALPYMGASGNNIYLPNDDKELFNICDLYAVGDGYISTMQIPIIEGTNFNEINPTVPEVLVTRSFVDKMREIKKWENESPIGKEIIVTEHSKNMNHTYTICGVIENFTVGSAMWKDIRPAVIFYHKTDHSGEYMSYLVIRLNEVNAQNINTIQAKLDKVYPEQKMIAKTLISEFEEIYSEMRGIRDGILIAGLVALVINIVGLMGYSLDEANRKRKEVAIRRISGATTAELLRLFVAKIQITAIVAIFVGAAGAYLASQAMLQMLSEKISYAWLIIALTAVLIWLIVNTVVVLTSWKSARVNPVENLSNE